MRRITGIGDLHLDGNLADHIPNFNDMVGNEVRSVLKKARRAGSQLVVFYGDIAHRPVLSDDARRVLLELFREHDDMRFILYRGNHDTFGPQSTEACSLDPLYEMERLGYLPNVRIVRHHPTNFFTNSDTPIRVLPWPYTNTEANMLNFLHVEAVGATWETGRPVEEGLKTKHLCCIGHIHTAQKVRNSHYSGTLYQTNFGEAQDKFYHDILWTGDPATTKVKLIQHSPLYVLENAVVSSMESYREVRQRIQEAPPTKLWKVFIHKSKVVLPQGAFDDLPTVIKHTPYASKQDLVLKINEEINLEDRSSSVHRDTNAALEKWMLKNGIEPDLQARALDRLQRLLTTTD